MNVGDLVRIRDFRLGYKPNGELHDTFNKIGVLITFDSLMGTAQVATDGVVQKHRLSDLQLVRRSPENKERLMSLGKIKYFPHQIFCDMDGVLVDFEGAATKSVNEALSNPPEGLESLCEAVRGFYGDSLDLTDIKVDKRKRPTELKDLIGELFENDMDWWANLPFLPEGRKLWSVLSKIEPSPMLLTSPMDHNGGTASEKGKIIWVRKNLNILDNIRWDERINFSHNKYEFAKFNDEPSVLIDDYPRKVDPFNEHGGFGVLHKGCSKETIKNLEEIFDGSFRPDLGKNT